MMDSEQMPHMLDAADSIVHRLEGWAKAYPTDIFREVTQAEIDWLHETKPGLIDRISASMGRHMAGCIQEDIAKLRQLISALEQREAVPVYGPGSNTGHGHVWKRPDGVTARCGGPVLCLSCRADAKFYATPPRDVPEDVLAEAINRAIAAVEPMYGERQDTWIARVREHARAMLAAAPSGEVGES